MRPSTAGECAAARAGRASRPNAPLPAARAPWLFLAPVAPVRRRAPRSSALQQPPHRRSPWWGQLGSRVRILSNKGCFPPRPSARERRALHLCIYSLHLNERGAPSQCHAAGGLRGVPRGLSDAWVRRRGAQNHISAPGSPWQKDAKHRRETTARRGGSQVVSRGSPNTTTAAAQGRSARNSVKQRSLVEPPAQGAARSDTRTYQRNRREPWPRSPTPPL